jgi:glycosyltransferase involved in cell wall biosynthesis
MKWGLIARSETDRGIGIQTLAMYQNLCPDKTLVVIDKKSGFEPHPENYPDATLVELKHGTHRNTLDQTTVRDWWKGLDVIIAVETLYDWDMIEWAKADKIKTVVHGNPEFWVATNPQPDQWIWPTTWRLNHLPTGPVVPVPVPNRPIVAADPHHPGLVKALHTAGSATIGVRNGTDIAALASRRLSNSGVKFTVYSQGPTAAFHRALVKPPVKDRWEMYVDQHILILPRRYGGLCLPALEAMACGLAVAMPDCPPNRDWPTIRFNGETGRTIPMQTGPVPVFEVYANEVTNRILHYVHHRDNLAEVMQRSRDWAEENRWPNLAPLYYDTLERVRSLR